MRDKQNLTSMNHPIKRHLKLLFASLLFLIGAIAMLRDTYYQGQDFEVYWRAGRAAFEKKSIYSGMGGNGMYFKYPPWILPAFIPFALVPLKLAKIFFGILEVFSLLSILVFLSRLRYKLRSLVIVTLLFWGIWAVHALDGQIVLPLVALVIWLKPTLEHTRKHFWSEIFIFWALSAKVFSLFAFFGALHNNRILLSTSTSLVTRPKGHKLRLFASIFIAMQVLSAPALISLPYKYPLDLYKDWIQAASSGDQAFGFEKISGRENQGLPALVLRRFFSENTANSYTAPAISLALMFIFGLLWLSLACSHKPTPPATSPGEVNDVEKWFGWLALVPVVHPLAWNHLFIFSFPLAVTVVDRSLKLKNLSTTLLALLGVICIAAVSRNTFGNLGEELELLSIRSWGVLICLFVTLKINYKHRGLQEVSAA